MKDNRTEDLQEMPMELLKKLPKMLEDTNIKLRKSSETYFNRIQYFPDRATILLCIDSYMSLMGIDSYKIVDSPELYPEIPSFTVKYHKRQNPDNCVTYWRIEHCIFDILSGTRMDTPMVLSREDFIEYFLTELVEYDRMVEDMRSKA